MALEDVVTGEERRRGYVATGAWDDSTLSARVAALAAEGPQDTAVIDGDGTRRHTYAELDADASAVAVFLQHCGVRPGDVVSVQLPNWYETVVVDVGAQRAGAVINPLLPVYRRKELLHVCSVAAPKVVFTPVIYRGYDHQAETSSLLAEVGREEVGRAEPPAGDTAGGPAGDTAAVHVVVGPGEAVSPAVAFETIVAGRSASRPGSWPGEQRAEAVSELIFTSGTEATPKAIMHTEQTANFGVRAAASTLGLGPDDVVWMPSPIGHSTGFNFGVRLALYHGLPLVLQDRWDAAVAVELVAAEGATYTLASTTFLQDLVTEAERRAVSLPTLRRFGCGGAPVPPALVRRAQARDIGVLRLYGSTEALVATWNRPDSPADKMVETDGCALEGIEVEVRADDGTVLPAGQAGEIFVRGAQTCVGFFRDPDRTAATFDPDGWVASGDLAVIDGDGYLTIVGRKKELIIRGGMNIAPREIEELVLAFDEVDRVAVVGFDDPRLGERMCACVVLAPGATLTLEEVVARLRAAGLATYKLPERLEILAELPMTASGKVQKHVIVANLRTD